MKQTSGDGGRAKSTVLIGTSLRDLPVQRHFATLGRELVDSDYHAVLLVHGPIEDTSYVDPRVRVLRWPSPRPTRLADVLFFDRLVRRLKPCCVISNFGALAIMMTVGGLRRVPVRIHWHHTLASQIEADWAGSRLGLRLLRLRARIPFSFVTHAVANSNAAKQDLLRSFGVPAQKCRIFWNAVEDPLAPLVSTAAARGNGANSGHFVCVGRFAASKGQDILLKAMAQVVKEHPNVTVECIGDGSSRASCQEMARELGLGKNCRFSGLLPHPEVLSRMASAWATIVPSRSEAFGLVNIESMAVGVPVIGSNTGGIAEVIRDREDGFLFPPNDHNALAQRMIEMLQNESLRASMAKNARLRFLEHFEITRAVQTQARWIIEQVSHSQERQSIGRR